jgi:uncharacterized protein YbjT (DUF2867 family)
MDIAIAGAHGKVARRLARLLVGRGDQVRGLIRNPDHAADLRTDGSVPVVCDLESAGVDEVAAAIAGADAVVFAAGAGRYVMISSIGAENPPEGDDVFSTYLRAKAEADRALMASDRVWTVVRPVSLTDDPGTGHVRMDVERLDGKVSRDDVAAVLAAVLHEPRSMHLILYVTSGDTPVEEALTDVLAL